jgi:hypothetical protein
MLFRSALSAVVRVSMMPPVERNDDRLLFSVAATPVTELKSDATVPELLEIAAVSAS